MQNHFANFAKPFCPLQHIFKLRCAPAAHPTVQEVMKMLLGTLKREIPVIFDDIPYGCPALTAAE